MDRSLQTDHFFRSESVSDVLVILSILGLLHFKEEDQFLNYIYLEHLLKHKRNTPSNTNLNITHGSKCHLPIGYGDH